MRGKWRVVRETDEHDFTLGHGARTSPTTLPRAARAAGKIPGASNFGRLPGRAEAPFGAQQDGVLPFTASRTAEAPFVAIVSIVPPSRATNPRPPGATSLLPLTPPPPPFVRAPSTALRVPAPPLKKRGALSPLPSSDPSRTSADVSRAGPAHSSPRRARFFSPSFRFESRRRTCEPRVGRVFLRRFGVTSARATISRSRARASSRLRD
jgi:hypothetical protein